MTSARHHNVYIDGAVCFWTSSIVDYLPGRLVRRAGHTDDEGGVTYGDYRIIETGLWGEWFGSTEQGPGYHLKIDPDHTTDADRPGRYIVDQYYNSQAEVWKHLDTLADQGCELYLYGCHRWSWDRTRLGDEYKGYTLPGSSYGLVFFYSAVLGQDERLTDEVIRAVELHEPACHDPSFSIGHCPTTSTCACYEYSREPQFCDSCRNKLRDRSWQIPAPYERYQL